jgi:hypothetical protein
MAFGDLGFSMAGGKDSKHPQIVRDTNGQQIDYGAESVIRKPKKKVVK